MRLVLFSVAVLGCSPSQRPGVGPGDSAETTQAGTTGSTGTTDSGQTGTTPFTTTYDCSQPWPASLGSTVMGSVPASEDFDIDADGNLVHVEATNLVVRNSIDNSVTVIAPNLTWSAAGTRVLRNGDVVVADTVSGSLIRVDRQTGGTVNLLNQNWPNGIDVDADDNVYVSDFAENGSVTRVNAYNPGDIEVLLSGVDRPNGVALSPDGETLYVAANWSSEIWALHRDGSGQWGAPTVFSSNSGGAQSVTTDVCGAVYWEALDTVRRKSEDGALSGDVTTAPGFQYLPNLRWGHGVGRFKEGHLYALSRGELWEFHVGVPGKRHISAQ